MKLLLLLLLRPLTNWRVERESLSIDLASISRLAIARPWRFSPPGDLMEIEYVVDRAGGFPHMERGEKNLAYIDKNTEWREDEERGKIKEAP